MKKMILICALFLSFGVVTTSSAQTTDIKAAVHAGVPVGDAADVSDFAIGADVTYLFGLAGIIEAGPMIGYSHFFESSENEEFGNVDAGDFQFIPVAASGRVDLPGFFAGLDLGYAIGLGSATDGGFYYRPKIGFGFFGLNVIGSYSSVSMDGGNVSAVTAGVEFGF